jgi:hypothetical protein
MKMLAEYLEKAITFETLAAAENDAKVKADLIAWLCDVNRTNIVVGHLRSDRAGGCEHEATAPPTGLRQTAAEESGQVPPSR